MATEPTDVVDVEVEPEGILERELRGRYVRLADQVANLEARMRADERQLREVRPQLQKARNALVRNGYPVPSRAMAEEVSWARMAPEAVSRATQTAKTGLANAWDWLKKN